MRNENFLPVTNWEIVSNLFSSHSQTIFRYILFFHNVILRDKIKAIGLNLNRRRQQDHFATYNTLCRLYVVELYAI